MHRKLSRCFEWCTLHRDPGATSFRSTVVSLAPLLPCKECLRSRSPKTPRAPARAWWSTPGVLREASGYFGPVQFGDHFTFSMIRFSMSPGSWKSLDDSERSNHLHTENPIGSTELSLKKKSSRNCSSWQVTQQYHTGTELDQYPTI